MVESAIKNNTLVKKKKEKIFIVRALHPDNEFPNYFISADRVIIKAGSQFSK